MTYSKMLIGVSSVCFLLIFLCPAVYALELAELRTETAEELLLFFEEEELVIATRSATPVRKAPAIATVITAKEIRNMGARNLLDILGAVPGIGVSISELPTKHALEVRGIRTKNSEKVLVMIDGHRVNNAVFGSAINTFGSLSVDNIKKVEVIRGPGSALYGANAFTAVINVVTKGAGDIDGLQITSGLGSFDTQHYNLIFGHGKDKLQLSGHFDYLDTDGASSFIEEDAIGNSGDTLEWVEKPDIGFKIIYADVSFLGRYIKNERGPYIGVGRALNDESAQSFEHVFGDLAWRRTLTEDFDVTARLYADLFKLDLVWEIFPEGFGGVYPDGMRGNPRGKNRTVGGELTSTYSVSSHMLTAGITYENIKQYDIKSLGNFNPITFAPLESYQEIAKYNKNVERNVLAMYVQDVWDITDDIVLTMGVRRDNYSDFGGTINPRAGLVWEFLEKTSLKLLYGSAFRAPSFTELYTINNPAEVGSPDLKPEKINTYEAGVEHRLQEKYIFRLNYFYNDIDDLIALGAKPSPTEPAPYENVGKAKVDGIEAEILFDFGNDNYGHVNYSYQHPVDGDTGRRLPDVPAHRASAVINFAPWKYLNTNISVSWTGKRYRDDRDTRDDLPDETLVNLTLIAKNFYRTMEIRGSVYNLFDEYYLDPAPFPVQVPDDYPANRRMFLIEARYTF